jgi:hypothetical protein
MPFAKWLLFWLEPEPLSCIEPHLHSTHPVNWIAVHRHCLLHLETDLSVPFATTTTTLLSVHRDREEVEEEEKEEEDCCWRAITHSLPTTVMSCTALLSAGKAFTPSAVQFLQRLGRWNGTAALIRVVVEGQPSSSPVNIHNDDGNHNHNHNHNHQKTVTGELRQPSERDNAEGKHSRCSVCFTGGHPLHWSSSFVALHSVVHLLQSDVAFVVGSPVVVDALERQRHRLNRTFCTSSLLFLDDNNDQPGTTYCTAQYPVSTQPACKSTSSSSSSSVSSPVMALTTPPENCQLDTTVDVFFPLREAVLFSIKFRTRLRYRVVTALCVLSAWLLICLGWSWAHSCRPFRSPVCRRPSNR